MQQAIAHVSSIAAVPGVSALMLGPGDLRKDLELPLNGSNEPKFLRAVDCLIEASRNHLISLMITTFKASVRDDQWLSAFSVHLAAADALSITNGFQDSLRDIKAGLLDNKGALQRRGTTRAAHGSA